MLARGDAEADVIVSFHPAADEAVERVQPAACRSWTGSLSVTRVS